MTKAIYCEPKVVFSINQFSLFEIIASVINQSMKIMTLFVITKCFSMNNQILFVCFQQLVKN